MNKALFIVGVLGLIVAGYLAFEYETGGPIICNFDGGCETVRASEYSTFAGISTPLYGVLFYVLLTIGAELWHGEKDSKMYTSLKILTASGLIVSAVLTYIEAFVIDAWCLWCVASAILSVIAFGIVWFKPRTLTNN